MSIVKVNVGGVVFTTTLATLQKAKYFTELALQPDLSEVVIDRNPQTFSYLLDCLRDSRYIKPELLEEHKNEIDYFGIDCLKLSEESRLTVEVAKDSPFYVEENYSFFCIKAKSQCSFTKDVKLNLKITVTAAFNGYVHTSRLDAQSFTAFIAGGPVHLGITPHVTCALIKDEIFGFFTVHQANTPAKLVHHK